MRLTSSSATEEAECLVIPPRKSGLEPCPVILFLVGNGHIDDHQDLLAGGVDLLLQNSMIREHFFLLVPKPSTRSGLLEHLDAHQARSNRLCCWVEEQVWTLFTTVLQRLGKASVDLERLYATGMSMGCTGVWNIAIRYGHMLAAIAPIAGRCGWPGNSWPISSETPSAEVLRCLEDLSIRIYQTSTDAYDGNPREDAEWLNKGLEEETSSILMPGVETASVCKVLKRSWRKPTGAVVELWWVEGPLSDWPSCKMRQLFNDHILWYRVYPKEEWGLASFFLDHKVALDKQLRLL